MATMDRLRLLPRLANANTTLARDMCFLMSGATGLPLSQREGWASWGRRQHTHRLAGSGHNNRGTGWGFNVEEGGEETPTSNRLGGHIGHHFAEGVSIQASDKGAPGGKETKGGIIENPHPWRRMKPGCGLGLSGRRCRNVH